MAGRFGTKFLRQGLGMLAMVLVVGCGDKDNDGFSVKEGDCDDTNILINPDGSENDSVTCADGQDNDCDGSIDCNDLDCQFTPQCFCIFNPNDPSCLRLEICNDGASNDDDNLIDCNDPDCTDGNPNNQNGAECAGENCGNVDANGNPIDDDGDGLANCADPGCNGSPQCNGGGGVENGATCFDSLDNDNDGLFNCDDPDCAEECNGNNNPEICNNGIDDNNNTLTDCSDTECFSDPGCNPNGGGGEGADPDPLVALTQCSNCIDDDNDGLIDCEDVGDFINDFGCAFDFGCIFGLNTCAPTSEVGLCDNIDPNNGLPLDDDGDGLANCADSDCANDPACQVNSCGAPTAGQFGANAGNTAGATNVAAGSCQTQFGGGNGADVLFSLTAPANGNLRFDLNSASDQGVFVQTTCGDANSELGCGDAFFGNVNEGLLIPVAGQDLSILVGAFGAADTGPFTLTIAADPGNGTCAAPFVAIAGVGGATIPGANNAGDSTGAADAAAPSCQPAGVGEHVFQLTPTGTTANLRLETTDPNADMVLFAQSGTCGTGTQLGCQDVGFAGENEILNLTGLTAGVPIFVFVGGFNAAGLSTYNLFIQ